MKKLSVKGIVPDSRDLNNLYEESQIPGVKSVYRVIENIRDKIREDNETKPKNCPENLLDDYVFKAGAIWALNWVLSLPVQAKEYMDKL